MVDSGFVGKALISAGNSGKSILAKGGGFFRLTAGRLSQLRCVYFDGQMGEVVNVRELGLVERWCSW